MHYELIMNYMASMDLVIPALKLHQAWYWLMPTHVLVAPDHVYYIKVKVFFGLRHTYHTWCSLQSAVSLSAPHQEVLFALAKRYAILGSAAKKREIKDWGCLCSALSHAEPSLLDMILFNEVLKEPRCDNQCHPLPVCNYKTNSVVMVCVCRSGRISKLAICAACWSIHYICANDLHHLGQRRCVSWRPSLVIWGSKARIFLQNLKLNKCIYQGTNVYTRSHKGVTIGG